MAAGHVARTGATDAGHKDSPRPLVFHDLGPLLVERAGQPVPIRGQRLTSALALLLVNANYRVSTDALVDAVWGDEPGDNAATTLESHLWRLRRALEPDRRRGEPFTTIVHDTGGYRLAVTADQVDSARLPVLAGQARDLLVSDQPARALARCEEALGLWRGEPWTPHTDEDWAQASVNRLREVVSQVAELRIQALLATGDTATALSDVEPLLAGDPLRERLWELAMVAAYRDGRVQHALDTYTRARRTLLDEAGIEPGQELRALHAQILRRDAALDQPASSRGSAHLPLEAVEVHLPPARTALRGRHDELAGLADLITRERLVSLVGPAGCGKTKLSVEAARQAATGFSDGVWFVDLTAAGGAGQLLDVLTSTLALQPPTVGSVLDAVRAYTRRRRMLLVLDNCEHLLDEVAELVEACVSEHSELTVLATSREPLALDGERVVELTPLALPLSGQDPRDAPSVQLFLERLATAAPGLVVGPRQLELVSEICARVDALPLAIELAAGQARSFGLEEIADRVRDDPGGLSRVGRRGSRHHDTLRGAIDLSVQTLTPAEAAVHRAVAVVPGPFTADLAADLADQPLGQTAGALGNLAHRSMLSTLGARTAGRPSRFTQLATIRSHGLTSSSPQEREAAERRRDEWVARLMADLPHVGLAAELPWYARIDDNLAAVRATLQHCLVEEPSAIGVLVASRLGVYFFYRGMVVEWERWTSLAMAVRSADPFHRLLVACSQAAARGVRGQEHRYDAWFAAIDAFPRPLSQEEKVWLGEYVFTACLISWVAREPEVGQEAVVRMAAYAQETGDANVALLLDVGRVLMASQVESPDVVLPVVEEVYLRCQAAGNHYGAWAVAITGAISAAIGRLPAAGLHWSDVLLQHFDDLGAEVNIYGLELRGTLLAQAGRPLEALRVLARSRALALRFGTAWPTLPSTAELVRTLEGLLPTAAVNSAYRDASLPTGMAEESADLGRTGAGELGEGRRPQGVSR